MGILLLLSDLLRKRSVLSLPGTFIFCVLFYLRSWFPCLLVLFLFQSYTFLLVLTVCSVFSYNYDKILRSCWVLAALRWLNGVDTSQFWTSTKSPLTKICYDQCYNDIQVVIATKWRHIPILLAAVFPGTENFFPKCSLEIFLQEAFITS